MFVPSFLAMYVGIDTWFFGDDILQSLFWHLIPIFLTLEYNRRDSTAPNHWSHIFSLIMKVLGGSSQWLVLAENFQSWPRFVKSGRNHPPIGVFFCVVTYVKQLDGWEHHTYFWNRKYKNLHSGKLTWNPKMEVWKMTFLFKVVILRFHASFFGSTWKTSCC